MDAAKDATDVPVGECGKRFKLSQDVQAVSMWRRGSLRLYWVHYPREDLLQEIDNRSR